MQMLEQQISGSQRDVYKRQRIDSIKYKVDVNTMEHLSIDNGKLSKETLPMQLNQIAVSYTHLGDCGIRWYQLENL